MGDKMIMPIVKYPRKEKIKLKKGYKIIEYVDYTKYFAEYCVVSIYDDEGNLLSRKLKKNPYERHVSLYSDGAV